MSDAAPDLTRAVLGFRVFAATSNACLRSTGVDYHWKPGPNHATCLAFTGGFAQPAMHRRMLTPGGQPAAECEDPQHAAPDPQCHCGLYALHTPDLMGAQLYAFATRSPMAMVAGVIRAWGSIEVHLDGFRAQHAEVRALLRTQVRAPSGVLELAAERYGLELLSLGELKDLEYLAKWGERIPDSLLPDRVRLETHLEALRAYATVPLASGSPFIHWATSVQIRGVPAKAPPPRFRWWGVGIYMDLALAATNFTSFALYGSWFNFGVGTFCLAAAGYVTRQWRRRKRWA